MSATEAGIVSFSGLNRMELARVTFEAVGLPSSSIFLCFICVVWFLIGFGCNFLFNFICMLIFFTFFLMSSLVSYLKD